jgi:integrase
MKKDVVFEDLLKSYRFPKRLESELLALIKGNLKKPLSTTRVSPKNAAFKTQERRLYSMFRTIAEIRDLGYKIESPWSLDNRHMSTVVKHWVTKGQEVGTMQGKLSHMKALAHWMGKFDLVKSLYDYVSKEELTGLGKTRKYVTTTDKSWKSHGISAMELIAKVEQDDQHVAIQLKLQAAFGLRIEESFSLPIKKTILGMLNRADGKMVVEKGTKGGRRREVPIQVREAVLIEALKLANEKYGSTTPEKYNIETWRNHYNYIMDKHGITKKGLGVTSHGLRHEWAQEFYKSLTGSDAPIKGSDEKADIETHKSKLREAVEALGHSKPDKIGMYISTPAAMAKLKAPVVTLDDVHRAIDATGGNKKAAAASLGISRQSVYRMLGSGARNG